jgi:hypothetical protein
LNGQLRQEAIRRGLIQEPQAEKLRPRVTLSDIRIQTKNRRIVPFIPNPDQVNLLDTYLSDWRAGDFSQLKGIHELILKARQLGFSTLIEILFFIDTINTPNTRTVVLSKDQATADNIFLMVKTMYDLLPEEKRPHASTSTTTEYYWPEINSRYESHTVGSGGVGRSLTINNLHWSEVAHSRNSQKAAADILNAVPEDGNVFLETTAKGTGEFFHQEWIKAETGESSYNHRFVNWTQNKDYERDPEKVPPFASEKELAREQVLRDLYGLTERQIAFRRAKMREPGQYHIFVQEFPLTAREAFISSGDPFFMNEKLNDLYEAFLREDQQYTASIDFERWEKLVHAYSVKELRIYEPPADGEDYVIGADPSEGLTKSGDSDYACAQVLRCSDGKQVAAFRAKYDPKTFGELLDQLGRFFNDALLGVERNNHGHAVLVTLIDICNYPNVYEHEEYDQKKDSTYKKPGYPTTPKTRTLALDSLNVAITFDDIYIYDLMTLSELMSFVKLPGGKYAADKGCHDDLVMSLAIANMMLSQDVRLASIPIYSEIPSPSMGQILRGY